MRDDKEYFILNSIHAFLGGALIGILIRINVEPEIILFYACLILFLAVLFRMNRLQTYILLKQIRREIRNG